MAKQDLGSINSPEPGEPLGEQDIGELCRLLTTLSPSEIAELKERLDNPNVRAVEISKIIGDAVRLSVSHDDKLARNLSPLIEEGVGVSIKKNPQRFSDFLAPVMGPAIRASIINTMRDYIDSIDRVLQQSMSLRGMLWRLEALRTGRSFTEVALFHSVVYRVEHAFVIRKSDGILLAHAAVKEADKENPDLISGMLTAIQDFVRDSFHMSADENLGTLQMGRLSVFVVSGGEAYLAAVTRGTTPSSFREDIQRKLEQFHYEYHDQLEHFDGDTEPYEAFVPALEELLQVEFKDGARTEERSYGRLLFVTALIAIGAAYWGYHGIVSRSEWLTFLEDARNLPGVVITEASDQDRRYFIRGLKDPLAAHPQQVFESRKFFQNKELSAELEPYIAIEPEIVIKRVTQKLSPPKSVRLSLSDTGILIAAGEAPNDWVKSFLSGARFITGVAGIDSSKLINADLNQLKKLANQIETYRIYFSVNGTSLSQKELAKIDSLAEEISQYHQLATALGIQPLIEMLAYAGAMSLDDHQQQLARSRLQILTENIRALGAPMIAIKNTGLVDKLNLCTRFPENCKKDAPGIRFSVPAFK